jgi:hypothetical protein
VSESESESELPLPQLMSNPSRHPIRVPTKTVFFDTSIPDLPLNIEKTVTFTFLEFNYAMCKNKGGKCIRLIYNDFSSFYASAAGSLLHFLLDFDRHKSGILLLR